MNIHDKGYYSEGDGKLRRIPVELPKDQCKQHSDNQVYLQTEENRSDDSLPIKYCHKCNKHYLISNSESPKDKVKRLLKEAEEIWKELYSEASTDVDITDIARMLQIENNKKS